MKSDQSLRDQFFESIFQINPADQSLRDQFFESIFQINPADQTFGEIGTIDHVVIDYSPKIPLRIQ
jgi:hypothetical protein